MHLWLKHFQINYANLNGKESVISSFDLAFFFSIFGDVKMLFHIAECDIYSGQNWNQTRNYYTRSKRYHRLFRIKYLMLCLI